MSCPNCDPVVERYARLLDAFDEKHKSLCEAWEEARRLRDDVNKIRAALGNVAVDAALAPPTKESK